MALRLSTPISAPAALQRLLRISLRAAALISAGIITTTVALTLTSSLVFAASPITNLEYDANGNLTKATDGLSHATTQQYDTVDRLIQQSQPHPTTSNAQLGTIKTQYNAIDQVTGVTDQRRAVH